MRKIITLIDDAGRTKVKITADADTKRFLTKRDLDRALRAIKLEYRQSIREHRRQKIMDQLEIKENGKSSSSDNELKRGKSASSENIRRDVEGTEPENPVPGNANTGLAGAITSKINRDRREKALPGGGTDEG